MKIFKYHIQITDTQRIEMPVGAKILTAQFQGKYLCLWALVDDVKINEMRGIEIFGTGQTIPGLHQRIYIGTVNQFNDIWHIFAAL